MKSKETSSTKPGKARTVALTQVESQGQPGKRPHSTMSRRRFLVLGIIQLAMILHVLHWVFSGETLSPVEPSESIEFAKDGVINAGFILFALAMLSTLILGRFFCGWACHIILLQDACSALLRRFGLRPKPFRSRWLMWAPLILALYMFIWPMVGRWGVIPVDAWMANQLGDGHWLVMSFREVFAFGGFHLPAGAVLPWSATRELTTEHFWSTFPPIVIAIPYLIVCSLGAVYFLGAKGFCTYGCPYGGFFAPLDEYAPFRIRVNDDCDTSGHCTAVCTSNVRVHEEVNIYGMVVSPGCMKCLDCVSACPNDALSVSMGIPAIAKKKAAKRRGKRDAALAFERGTRTRSRFHEFLLAITFVISLFCLRSVYGVIPLLMAMGMAGCLVVMLERSWQALRHQNASFHRYRLKINGSLSRAGYVFVTITALCLALTLHSGYVKGCIHVATYLDNGLPLQASEVFRPDGPPTIDAATEARARRALWLFEQAAPMDDGGWSLLSTQRVTNAMRRAGLLCIFGNYNEALDIVDRTLTQVGPVDDDNAVQIEELLVCRGLVLRAAVEPQEVAAWYDAAFDVQASLPRLIDQALLWGIAFDRLPAISQSLARRWETVTQDHSTGWGLAQAQIRLGQYGASVAVLEQLHAGAPDDKPVISALAASLTVIDRVDEAEAILRSALEQYPDEAVFNRQMGDLLVATGRVAEARAFLNAARAAEGK